MAKRGTSATFGAITSSLPVVESYGTGATGTNGTSHSTTKPSGVEAGDLLLLIISADDAAAEAITPPTGFIEVAYKAGDLAASAAADSIAVYQKIAGGSEGASYSWSTVNSERTASVMLRISGTGALCMGSLLGYADTANTADAPDLTTFINNCLIIRACNLNTTSSAATAPTTSIVNHTDGGTAGSSGTALSLSQDNKATAGAVGTKTFTITDGVANAAKMQTMTIVVGPAYDV
jgi:hypothetical protein